MGEINKLYSNRRDFIRNASLMGSGTLLLGGMSTLRGSNAVAVQSSDWYRDIYRQLHIDAHFGDFKKIYENFDAENAAQIFKDAGFQMVSYFSKCWAGYSYYPTKIGIEHPGLKRDFTGEMTDALKKRGIRRILYFMMGTERKIQRDHPEWVYNKDPKEKISPDAKNECSIMCFNSPYVDDYAIPQMKELVEKYDFDGFFIDIVMQQYLEWNCYCKNCRELYAKEVGGTIPESDADPNAFKYRKWSNSHMEKHIDKVQKALAAVKPDIVIINNYAWMSRYPVTPPDYVKHITWDTPTPKIGLYSADFSFEGRYLSTFEDKTWSCMNTRGNNWGEYSLRDYDAFAQECATLLAACGRTYLSDIPYPSGNPDPAVLNLFGDVNRRTENIEPVLKGSRPVSDTVILHSADSVWSKAPLKPSPTWTPGPAYYSVNGAHKALVEGHFQTNTINSQMFPGELKKYSLAILADQPILSKSEADAVRDFVRNGGTIFVTGDTATRGVNNERLGNFMIADVLGVDFKGLSDTANCYIRVKSPLKEFDIPAFDIQITGEYATVEKSTADIIMELLPPYEGIKNGTPPPALESTCPAITINSFGRGKALYCSARLFDSYYRESTPILRNLALALIEKIYPKTERKLYIENATINIEAFLNEKPGGKIVHLVNYSGDKRETGIPQIQDIPSASNIKVSVMSSIKPKKVISINDKKEIGFVFKNGRVEFDTNEFRIHGIYMIET